MAKLPADHVIVDLVNGKAWYYKIFAPTTDYTVAYGMTQTLNERYKDSFNNWRVASTSDVVGLVAGLTFQEFQDAGFDITSWSTTIGDVNAKTLWNGNGITGNPGYVFTMLLTDEATLSIDQESNPFITDDGKLSYMLVCDLGPEMQNLPGFDQMMAALGSIQNFRIQSEDLASGVQFTALADLSLKFATGAIFLPDVDISHRVLWSLSDSDAQKASLSNYPVGDLKDALPPEVTGIDSLASRKPGYLRWLGLVPGSQEVQVTASYTDVYSGSVHTKQETAVRNPDYAPELVSLVLSQDAFEFNNVTDVVNLHLIGYYDNGVTRNLTFNPSVSWSAVPANNDDVEVVVGKQGDNIVSVELRIKPGIDKSLGSVEAFATVSGMNSTKANAALSLP